MALTLKQAAGRLGPATLRIEKLEILVEVIDYAPAFGSDRWTVSPYHGSGEQTVDESRLKWDTENI
jgi:hypothetical protein